MTSRGESELADLESVFAALANASRRHVLVVLSARGGTMTAGEIAKRFAHSWPTTSRHLRTLRAAGLVETRRQGREVLYRLRRDRLRSVVGRWLDWLEAEKDADGNGR
ncbi:MAG TPA: metalloregulator ArsR/SmtB family transcription factor [Caulobacteraceae bacterium]|nr:metalloregulator ArsR/SmtB family transcription factor [Caulobacteraceae bacterium]